MRLQLVAVREDGASTAVEKIPGSLRIHLILRAQRPRPDPVRTFAARPRPASSRGAGSGEV